LEKLLPDRLKGLWKSVEEGRITGDEFYSEQEHLLSECRRTWREALLIDRYRDLQDSLLQEMGDYFKCGDIEEIRRKCLRALSDVKGEWDGSVNSGNRGSVEEFYNRSEAMVCELMWWHTLAEDSSPLAYVVAMEFGKLHGCAHCLDFGCGVGSGGIVFARHGMEITFADISSLMLDFSEWRFKRRNLPARRLDLKVSGLPASAFDMVTAMDVFEHLVDPVQTVDEIWKALVPGGYLFGRFHSEPDEDRPHHIIHDFGPTLQRLKELGFVEEWRDEWLWGHQVFRKA
jgi:2-polyprenyl-3-methyl-5-hydroxy-6-metoxy-1,4-benzoquinol methylase